MLKIPNFLRDDEAFRVRKTLKGERGFWEEEEVEEEVEKDVEEEIWQRVFRRRKKKAEE